MYVYVYVLECNVCIHMYLVVYIGHVFFLNNNLVYHCAYYVVGMGSACTYCRVGLAASGKINITPLCSV